MNRIKYVGSGNIFEHKGKTNFDFFGEIEIDVKWNSKTPL
jgi:hypothetical protein